MISLGNKKLPIKDGQPSVVCLLPEVAPFVLSIYSWLKNNPICFRFLLITTDSESAGALAAHPELKSLFDLPSFKLQVLAPDAKLSEAEYEAFFQPQERDRKDMSYFVSLQGLDAAHQSLWAQLQGLHRVVVSQLQTSGPAFVGSVRSVYEGFENFLTNIQTFLSSPDFRNWNQLYLNKPAFILGAGPSLNEQSELISKYQDRAITIAADTLASSLYKKEIQPDIFCAIERVKETRDLLLDAAHYPQSVLVASAYLKKEATDVYQGSKAIFLPGSDLNKFIRFARMVIQYGHSCVGLAMRVAKILGCRPIYLFGVDLSYGESGESHFSGNPYESNQEVFAGSLERLGKLHENAIYVEANNGEKKRTNHIWSLFRSEFELIMANSPGSFFNLSEKGAKLKNAEYLPSSLFEEKMAGHGALIKASLAQSLEYERSKEALAELQQFVGSLRALLVDLAKLKDLKSEELLKALKSSPFFDSFYSAFFAISLTRLQSVSAEMREVELNNIETFAGQLFELIQREIDAVENFASQAAGAGQRLF